MTMRAARPARPEPAEGPDSLVGLMVEYQAGRLEAFESLYAELAGDLRRHFDAVMRGGVASDLVQETFMEMHRSRHTYEPPLPVRPWAFGIARNVLRRHRRLAFRRWRIEDAEAARLGSVARGAARVEARDVRDALHLLPKGRRQAFELHHLHGFTFVEIARMLRIPEGAAKLRSSRAMGALRSLLDIGGKSRG